MPPRKRCEECDACQEWLLAPDQASACTNPKPRERYYVVFESSFRSESTPCISHETRDKVRTLCGRPLNDGSTFEPDSNELDPDCISCRRKARKLDSDDQKQTT